MINVQPAAGQQRCTPGRRRLPGTPSGHREGVAFASARFNWARPPQPDGRRLQRAQSGQARQVTSRPHSCVVIKLPTYVAGGSLDLDSLLEQDHLDYARSTFDSGAAHDAAAVRIGIHGSIGPGLGSGLPSVGVGLMAEQRKVGKGHPLHVDKQNMSK